MEDFSVRINNIKMDLIKRKGAKETLEKNINSLETEIEELQESCAIRTKASIFLNQVLDEQRNKSLMEFEKIGTEMLKFVYDDSYKLKFDTHKTARDNGEVDFRIEIKTSNMINGQELLTNPLTQKGGGVCETIAFALKMAVLNFSGYNGPLVLDESWKSVSADSKVDSVARCLKSYSVNHKRQIIFSTHRADVFGKFADNIYRVEREANKPSTVRDISYETILEELAELNNVSFSYDS